MLRIVLYLLILSLLYDNISCYISISKKLLINKCNINNNKNMMLFDSASISDQLIDLPVTILPLSVLISSFGLFKFIVYSRMQFVTASMIGGIPPKSKIVEIDAKDGKNIFYLSKECDYTAVMPITETDPKKLKDRSAINEQLVLESIGKANVGGLKLSGKLRQKTQDVPSRTVDTVISVGALSRSSNSYETLMEVNRMLRPGGLFVFVEPASSSNGETIKTIESIFPKEIVSTESAGAKLEKAKAKDMKKEKSKKSKKSKNSDVETFAIDEDNDSNEEINSNGEIITEEVIIKPIIRPGLTYEVLQNIIDPYITGIGIKP